MGAVVQLVPVQQQLGLVEEAELPDELGGRSNALHRWPGGSGGMGGSAACAIS